MHKFSVTYEIYPAPEDDDDCCDPRESGFVVEDESLREAIARVTDTEICHCSQSCIEPSDSRLGEARWITVYNSADYISGETEHRALHIPDGVTASSRRRIARLLGVRA